MSEDTLVWTLRLDELKCEHQPCSVFHPLRHPNSPIPPLSNYYSLH